MKYICFWDLAWSFNRDAKTSHFVLGNFFEQKYFFEKCLITELFSGCEWKVSGRIYKKNSKVSRRKSSRHEIHFKKIIFVLGLCRCLFRKIGKNVFVRYSKPQFNCPEVHNSWEKTAFGTLVIFSQIRVWSNSCLKVLWQFFDNLDKIAIQVSTETFCTKNVLFVIKTIFFLFTDFHWCIFGHSKKTFFSVLSIRHST